MTAIRSSPHVSGHQSVQRVMLTVWVATLPGFLALVYHFGWGHLVQAILATATALAAEAAVLRLRARPIRTSLGDGSALLTGWLLALALPPLAPWWIPVVGALAAIVLAKHLYGGLGHNPFNPAMTGFAVLLIAFPVLMTTRWAAPTGLLDSPPGIIDILAIVFSGSDALSPRIDAITMATPLDAWKTGIDGALASELRQNPVFRNGWQAPGWEWANLLYLAGGLALIRLRIITWHTPAAVLAGLGLMALLFSHNADLHIPVMLHLLGGATMLGAFFIATDPASSATSNRGKLVYGFAIGVLIYLIRTWGSYPDAVAFAVLLMNFAAPLIDHVTRPRVYGTTRGGP